MGRTSIEIDKKKLIDCMDKADKNKGLVEYWDGVAVLYDKVSPSTLKARAKDWGLTVEVSRKKMEGPSDMSAVRALKGVEKTPKRRKGDKTNIAAMKKMLVDHQQNSLLPLVTKVENGSLKSAVKLFCVMCCGYQKKEVSLCQSISCPLWSMRPYQKDVNEDLNAE